MAAGVDCAPQHGADRGRLFLGHPRALLTPVSVEVWERFSFYGMRAILGLYLLTPVTEGGIGLPPATALSLTAIYSAGAYLTSVIGGWLADRFLGARRTVLTGGIVIMCGHILLAVPTTSLFYVGLAAVVLGTGLLKPNIASLVGALYSVNDHRRDSGFSIFYMGINIGGFVAPLVCGWLGQEVNYHAGFLAAAIGMGIGVTYFLTTYRRLPDVGPRAQEHLGERAATGAGPRTRRRTATCAVIVTVIVVATFALSGGGLSGVIDAASAATFSIPVVVLYAMARSPRVTPTETRRLVAYIPLFLASVAFWMMFEQGSTVLSELAANHVTTALFGHSFPSSWFLSINSLAIIVLAPAMAWFWIRLGRRDPDATTKMGTGVLVGGLSFLAVPLAFVLTAGDKISPLWLVGIYIVQAVAELALSPVGISQTTRLAPRAFANQTMGVWYLSMAAGSGLGAQLVGLSTRFDTTSYYGLLAAIGVVVGVVVLTLRRPIAALTVQPLA